VAHDFFHLEGFDYLAREYRAGRRISKLVPGGIPLDKVQDMAGQLLGFLEHIHAKGFVFLGLEPDNVLADEDWKLSLCDFGFARGRGERILEEEIPLIDSSYSAPETARAGSVDERADYYSFGALLFHMLTGKDPGGIKSVEDLDAVLKPGLRKAITRCLYQDPADRYQDSGELRRDLFAQEALDLPELKEQGDFSDIGEIRGVFSNDDLDNAYQARIMGAVFAVMAVSGILTPLVPRVLGVLTGLLFVLCFVAVFVVKNNSYFSFEIGQFGFVLKGPESRQAFSWAQVDHISRKKAGVRITVHFIDGRKEFLKTEDIDGLALVMEEASGKKIIIEKRKFMEPSQEYEDFPL
jgi:serine/threonine protein kinase